MAEGAALGSGAAGALRAQMLARTQAVAALPGAAVDADFRDWWHDQARAVLLLGLASCDRCGRHLSGVAGACAMWRTYQLVAVLAMSSSVLEWAPTARAPKHVCTVQRCAAFRGSPALPSQRMQCARQDKASCH